MEDKKGVVKEVEGVRNRGGSEIFSCMTVDISVCVTVVVLVVVVVLVEGGGSCEFRSLSLVCGGGGMFGSHFLVGGR